MHLIKYLLAISLAVVLSSCAPAQPKTTTKKVVKVIEVQEVKKEPTTGIYIWPIFFGSTTFFFSEMGPALQLPGYGFSGGATFSMFQRDFGLFSYVGNLFFFTDLLYSYRSYDGHPQKLHYSFKENTLDFALAGGYNNAYIGGYLQFPNKATVRVREWTHDDFDRIDRSTSFSFMLGYRMTGRFLGADVRLLLGQGPGQFMSSAFGDHWLGQLSLGIMGGF